jgi:phage shock protein PspC (stress-responsive transcriptional regulator)
MKKNISINISGIIFHIEEDGYDALRKYLDSINRYFGSFEDSSEILADIESRIAEIFLLKLNEGKQVITGEDVQSLINTMGNVSDFKAAEEHEVGGDQAKADASEETSTPPPAAEKKLYRDQRRKVLGGVCAGLGHYFKVDPIWPRLLFVLAALGTSGLGIVVYIVLWIALPDAHDLEEEPSVKKMFRNPGDKVIGGVASGIAAFFGTDALVIRLLFVVFTFFFGSGILLYIILWIVLPQANTITEKMKMQGEPVTLSNIESTVKKGLNEKGEEGILTKIILFPFRVIAAILNAVGRVLGPILNLLVDIIRIAFGVALSLVGFGLIISLIITFCLLVGIFTPASLPHSWEIQNYGAGLPLESIRQAFPTWTTVFAFFALFIPALFIMLIGNSIIAKRIVFHAIFGWTLFVLFLISIVFLSITIPQIVYSFREEGEIKIEKRFTTQGHKPVLRIKETGMDDYHVTDLSLVGYDGTDLKLLERFAAQGVTKLEARENAKLVDYQVEQKDSVITFDSNLTFKKGSKFRFQRLDMDLFIPFGQPFVIEEDTWGIIENHWKYDYHGHEDSQTFSINKDGKLECLTCPPPPKDLSGISQDDQFGLKDFNEVNISGAMNVIIQQGDEFAIRMEGKPDQKKRYQVDVDDETLEVTFNTKHPDFWKGNFNEEEFVSLTITMPSLRSAKLTGAGKFKIRGFHEDDMKLNLTGAMVGEGRLSVNNLRLESSGPVIFELEGDGDVLEASISGPGQFKAGGYEVNHATIEAHGLSQAKVHVKETLEIDKDFTSSVNYSGDPQVTRKD